MGLRQRSSFSRFFVAPVAGQRSRRSELGKIPSVHGPLRLAFVCTPVVGLRGCSPWAEDAAAALLVVLPGAYCLSLAVLALFVWLWRKQPEAIELEWKWLISYAAMLAAIAMIAARRHSWPNLEDLAIVAAHEALFICTCSCVVARLAIELGSKLVMRIGVALILAALVVPAALVFFVRTATGETIVLVMVEGLVGPVKWLCVVVLTTLFFGALVRASTAQGIGGTS
jgi:hypothetical protein